MPPYKQNLIARLFACLMAAALAMLATPAYAQLVPGGGEGKAEEAPVPDPWGRETPRSTVTQLLRALGDENSVAAAQYLALPESQAQEAPALALALQRALDAGGSLRPYSELSNDPAGRVGDGLAPDLEQVGTLGDGAATPILLQRREAGNGQAIWQVSSETLQAAEAQMAAANAVNPQAVAAPRSMVAGAPLRDWTTLIGFLLLAFIGFWLISRLLLYLVCRFLPDDAPVSRVLHAALPPLALFMSLVAFRIFGEDAQVSIVARQAMLRYLGILAWFALVWFGLRLVDTVAEGLRARMEGSERRQAASLIVFGKRVIKAALLAIALIGILDTLGFNVTTGIAALGFGGLVLALGAQKTVENFVGTVTVLADRPVQVGDFCRVGEVMGTIEDIGIRSTRIRTNERTVVTIPNGDFSSQRIENFSLRDRFLFQVVIGLEYDLSADRMRQAVDLVRAVLAEHPMVLEDQRRASLKTFAPDVAAVEAFGYIATTDYPESLKVRQELLLAMHRRLEEAEVHIAHSSRALFVRSDAPA